MHAQAHDARLRLRRSEVCLDQVFPTTRTVPRLWRENVRRPNFVADKVEQITQPLRAHFLVFRRRRRRGRDGFSSAPRPEVPRSGGQSPRAAPRRLDHRSASSLVESLSVCRSRARGNREVSVRMAPALAVQMVSRGRKRLDGPRSRLFRVVVDDEE